MLLRYEDFVDDPEGALRGILDLLSEECEALPFASPHEVDMGLNHTVSGDPNRFEVGHVTLPSSADWGRLCGTGTEPWSPC